MLRSVAAYLAAAALLLLSTSAFRQALSEFRDTEPGSLLFGALQLVIGTSAVVAAIGLVKRARWAAGAADGELLLLNPVIRWDGQLLGAGSATVNAPRTVALRWFACCLYAAAFTSMHVRRRRRVPSTRPVQV